VTLRLYSVNEFLGNVGQADDDIVGSFAYCYLTVLECMRSRFTVYGSRFRTVKRNRKKKSVCVKITISVSRLNMLWKLKLVLNHSAITKFVILNAEIEYFFIGYLFIVMRAAIFSYLSAIFKQFNYLLNLFCNIYN
jgi:hypothetical protein